jgi:hypothetical protein
MDGLRCSRTIARPLLRIYRPRGRQPPRWPGLPLVERGPALRPPGRCGATSWDGGRCPFHRGWACGCGCVDRSPHPSAAGSCVGAGCVDLPALRDHAPPRGGVTELAARSPGRFAGGSSTTAGEVARQRLISLRSRAPSSKSRSAAAPH